MNTADARAASARAIDRLANVEMYKAPFPLVDPPIAGPEACYHCRGTGNYRPWRSRCDYCRGTGKYDCPCKAEALRQAKK